ncbi:MAG: DUF58 domain-containing protein, partial [Armatimonadota bacterium]
MTAARVILIVVAVVAVAYVLHLGFFTFAFYALVLMLGMSWLMGRTALRGIAHQRVVSKAKARVGETLAVTTEVVNDKNLPVLWTLMEDQTPALLAREGSSGRACLLKPHQTTRLRYRLECTHRGYHQIGPLVLESGDIFGLFRRFRTGATANFVTVYPRVVPISRYEIATRRPIGEVRVTQRLYEDPTRIAGIRDYMRGDPLNRIHWKATAKTGRLHSKVYEPSTMIGANLALDFSRAAWEGELAFERSELAVVAAASIANYVSQQKQLVGFISNGRDAMDRAREELEERQASSRRELQRILAERERADRLRPVEVPARKGGANLLEMMETLARLELSDGLTMAKMLAAEYVRLPRDAALILIVPRVPTDLAEMIARLKATGFVVAVFVVFDQEEFIRAQARLSHEGVSVFHIQQEGDLDVLARRTI